MAESSWPSGAGTRVVTDTQYEVLGRSFAGDGVLQAVSDTAVVYGDSSGRQVKVRASKQAYLRGYNWDSGLTETIKTIAANSSGSTRYDVVVLRFTRSTLAVTVEVVQGVGGSGVPAVTQTSGTTGVWEMPLAVVTVINGATTIAAGDVSNVAPLLTPTGNITVPTLTALGYAYVSPVEGMRANLSGEDSDCFHDGSSWRKRPWSKSVTASVAAASLTVSGIPTDIKTLAFDVTSRGDNASATVDLYLRIGGDTGSVYNHHSRHAVNDGAMATFSGTGLARSTISYIPGASTTAGVFGNCAGTICGWDAPHASHLGGVCSGGYFASGANNIWSVINFTYTGSATRNSLTILLSAGNLAAGTRLTVSGTFA